MPHIFKNVFTDPNLSQHKNNYKQIILVEKTMVAL